MPDWYPLVRAVRYYKGAYTVHELASLPSYLTQWALTAESAEAEGERIAMELQKQRADLDGDGAEE
jgi:hypothetical protein